MDRILRTNPGRTLTLLLICVAVGAPQMPGQPKSAITGSPTRLGRLNFTLEYAQLRPPQVTVDAGTYVIQVENAYLHDAAVPFNVTARTSESEKNGSAGLAKLVANTVARHLGRSRVTITLAPGTYVLSAGSNSEWKSMIEVIPPKQSGR